MAEHLWPLLRLKADTDEELKEAYRKVFIETYIQSKDGKPVVITDWDGHLVHFNYRNFDHAFSESTDYRMSYGDHDIPLSMKRACRILWIKEVLAASKGSIERSINLEKTAVEDRESEEIS